MSIFTLRTTSNREEQIVDFVSEKVKKNKMAVYSLFHPHGMKGYLFIEAASRTEAERAVSGVSYIRGLLRKEVSYQEIAHLVEERETKIDIRKNDIVEIIAGPFKRERAKVTRINRPKEEIIVELIEASVPIPLTLSTDAVRVLQREEESETAEEK